MPDWSAFDDVDPKLPGLVVGVATAGTVTAVGIFGSVSPGGEQLGSSSLFYVASIAKQFTAAAVAVLALDGKLTLDDSVRRWLPELSPAWEPVRVGHLVAHTGGLPDGNPIDADAGWGAGCRMSTWDRVAIIAATEPTSPPGVHHRYSNHGYVLLAAVAERAADETLGAYARRTLFDPAGMDASRFLDTTGGTAVPGWAGGTERIDIQFTCCGDGGLVTSLDDLARWDGWLPSSRLARLMLTDRPSLPNGRVAHDAWGISIRRHHGLRIESHGGSIDGYLASFVRFPTAAVTLIMLANTDGFGVAEFGRRGRLLADSLLGNQLDRSRPPWTETHGERLDV